MAERELRRMNRMELIEIIYALKQHEEELPIFADSLQTARCGWSRLVPSPRPLCR